LVVIRLYDSGKYGMRNLINIVSPILEAKVVDGYWSGVSSSDLHSLVAQHGDLRGVAYGGEIFLGRAGHDIHHSMRSRLGIPAQYGEQHGFDFYVADVAVHYNHEEGDPDEYDGRDDWGVDRSPAFVVGSVAIWVSQQEPVCLNNRQFARMIGRPVTEAWHASMPSQESGKTLDIFKNPSRAELMKVIALSRYNEARGLVTATDLYVWNADADVHIGPMKKLGFRYDVDACRIMLDAAGPYINECDPMAYDDRDEETDEVVARLIGWAADHPVLSRLYGPDYDLGCR
jgi:hypothetical protein